jgi:hypothetical protein
VSTHVDVEELQTTKSEKLLALVMAAFLLVAAIWAYQEIDDAVRNAMPVRQATASEQVAIDRNQDAERELFRANTRVGERRQELVLRREAYRTALDANEPAAQLRARYLQANEAFEAARRERAAARRALDASRPAAAAAQERIARDAEERRDRQELVVFVLRLGLAVAFLLGSYGLLARLRERNSRYFALATATVAAAVVFAFVLAVDYLTDYFEPLDLGVLFLALLGAISTGIAFWVLQRYLARRLPRRRVRRGECPFCGFPVRGNDRCEGCGRTVKAACAACGAPRRVGSPHCGTCGAE